MEPKPALKPLPSSFATTVAALHRVAAEIVAPARKPDNEIALRATPGGFGTSRPVKLARCPGRTRNGDSPRPISCTQSWSPSLVPTQNPSSA